MWVGSKGVMRKERQFFSSLVDMIINPTLDFFTSIVCGDWDFKGENRTLLYLNMFRKFVYAVMALKGACDVTATIHPLRIFSFVDKIN